jgi:hypothetical protein
MNSPLWIKIGGGVAASLLTVALGLTLSTPAVAAPACAEPGSGYVGIPWQQEVLDPLQVWPSTRGGGVTVAVLDSGVDASQPQLRGRVKPGLDAITGKGAANTDCFGTGTQVAGVIAATPIAASGFAGLAPDVMILPIRVVAAASPQGEVADPKVLARGVAAAVDRGADVIVVSVVTYTSDPTLAAAVTAAEDKDITVVAAVGDLGDESNPTPYPASLAGVIGVGAIGPDGQRWSKSQYGSYVSLVAPGDRVVTLQRGSGMTTISGTGVAAGFVGATAALFRAKRGRLGVRTALLGTATPSPGGPAYGRGIVNPAAAVNDQVVRVSPSPLSEPTHPVQQADQASARSVDRALGGTVVAVVVVFLIVVAAVTMPRGRRRFWRAILAPRPRGVPEPEEPGPPLQLFGEPRSHR